MSGRLANHQNVKRYPTGFVYVVGFVDAQGLYRHMPFAISTFPNITETSGSNGVLTHPVDLFFGDGVRSGDELSVVA